MDGDANKDIIVIAGPTGTGKSEIAIDLARKLDGEIISADSMQVYVGMDIGTAKIPLHERNQVPHHLIDICKPCDEFDVAKWVSAAKEAIKRIQGKGKRPIVCGGTGLYIKALFCGIGQGPPKDPGLRSQLESMPMESLQLQLKTISPSTYEEIDIQNKRRVVRAVEIAVLTGRSPVQIRSSWSDKNNQWPSSIFVIHKELTQHTHLINSRVDKMIYLGLEEETKMLMNQGIEKNPSAKQAIGYRQMIQHIKGTQEIESTVEEIKLRTRQYAKRQRTWFRNQMPSKPIVHEDVHRTRENILSQL